MPSTSLLFTLSHPLFYGDSLNQVKAHSKIIPCKPHDQLSSVNDHLKVKAHVKTSSLKIISCKEELPSLDHTRLKKNM